MTAITDLRERAELLVALEREKARVLRVGDKQAHREAAARRERLINAMPDVIYPVYPQAAGSRCNNCWQPGPSAMCTDPLGDGTRRLCGRCAASLRTGWAVELATEQLTEAWEWLARQHINHRAGEDTGVTDVHIDWALTALTPPWMPPQMGWERFEGLCEDLLRHQEAEAGDYDPASLEPDWQDPETYVNHCRGLVDDAVHKLIGRTA